MKLKIVLILSLFLFSGLLSSFFKLNTSSDDPKALSPKQSLKAFKILEEYKIELVASEPLIKEPTGVCWDENGQLFVSELQ